MAAAALLAGCGGSQPPIGYSGTQFKSAERPNDRYALLYNFQAKPDGQNPQVRLIPFGPKLYGTTPVGGKGCAGKGCGIVFALTKAGKETVLHLFHGIPDGSYPMAELVVAKRKLYGTTDRGGASCRGATKSGCGTVFEIEPSGSERVVHRFANVPDGANPQGPLTLVDGTLYGTTAGGGTKCADFHGGCGTVYSVDTDGKEQVLYRFRGAPDGAQPTGNLVLLNGVLYGTTYEGGTNTVGTVFAVTLSGKERVVYSWGPIGPSSIDYPSGLVAVDGVLYGEASGGPHSGGVVYLMTTSGEGGIVYAFNDQHERDGDLPDGRLIGVSGVLYGTTRVGGRGGVNSYGTVFSLTTSGALTTLYRFKGPPDGQQPFAGVSDAKGVLYGTTWGGGTGCYHYGCNGGYGTVFRISR